MKFSKGLKAAIPVFALAVSMVPFNTFAQETTPNENNANTPGIMENENKATYSVFKGKVSDVRKNTLDTTFIRVEEGEQMYDFTVGDNTIFLTAEGVKPITDIKEGDELTVYYIQPLVNILIFPPQMQATVFVKEPGMDTPLSIYVGRFDENLVSDDNFMKINEGGEKTKIVDSTGKEVKEDIKGKDLAVVFGPMTMSIPGQTTPEMIVILDVEKDETETTAPPAEATETPEAENNGTTEAVPPTLELSDEEKQAMNGALAESIKDGKITVFGNEIEAPQPFVENGHVMLPLRAIAEAADYNVQWNADIAAITVGNAITLKVGEDYYTFARMAPITLGQAPVNVDGHVFVPMDFFNKVMRLDANVADGNIVITEMEAVTE